MYKAETLRLMEKALLSALSEEGALKALSQNEDESAENVALIAKVLVDQLWYDGYELEPRPQHRSMLVAV